jgi:hypothetical protein
MLSAGNEILLPGLQAHLHLPGSPQYLPCMDAGRLFFATAYGDPPMQAGVHFFSTDKFIKYMPFCAGKRPPWCSSVEALPYVFFLCNQAFSAMIWLHS